MLNLTLERTKIFLSKKYLDWAEILPKSSGGIIHHLQSIRQHQRDRSSKSFDARRIPKDSRLLLKEVRLVATFQFEDFRLVQAIIKKTFPNNKKTQKIVEELKQNEASLNELSWRSIGVMLTGGDNPRKTQFFTPDSQLVDDLPEHVRQIRVSYQRLLPSVALLAFNFLIEDTFSDELRNIQDREYLSPVMFNSVFPHNLLRSYTSGYESQAVSEAMYTHMYRLVSSQESWLKKRIGKGRWITFAPPIEFYELCGDSSSQDADRNWFNDNRNWLNNYGITNVYSYGSDALLYCPGNRLDGVVDSHKLIAYKQKVGDRLLDEQLDALGAMVALDSVTETLQNAVEIYRLSGFRHLDKFDNKILKAGSSITGMKRILPVLKRLNHELFQYRSWVQHALSGLNELKDTFNPHLPNLKVGRGLDQAVFGDIKGRIALLNSSSEIVDAGLTSYLEVQNVYAMYRLQRWAVILSCVTVFLSVVVACTEWKNLAELGEKIPEIWDKIFLFIGSLHR